MRRPHHPEQTFSIQAEESGTHLVDALARHLNVSRKKAKRLLDDRRVFVNRKRIWMARHRMQRGDQVRVLPPPGEDKGTGVRVLYRDADVLVLNKPAGCLSNAGRGSIEARARDQAAGPDLRVVHRLDRDTTGCLLAVLRPELFDAVVEQFRAGQVTKVYQAIVLGRLTRPTGEIHHHIDGKPSLTRYEVLAASELASHVRIQLLTGRTHQIRKHFSALRHPVAGDKRYCTGRLDAPVLRRIPRKMLHAAGLSLPHPATNAPLHVRAPLPADFTRTLNALRLRS